MTTENKRDLAEDLTLAESVQFVYYDEGGGYQADYPDNGQPRHYFDEAFEGWPEAIRRAIAAEAEVERLQAFIKHESECAVDVAAENTHLIEALRGLLEALACGNIERTRMSSGTDYVISRAKEALRNATQENNG